MQKNLAVLLLLCASSGACVCPLRHQMRPQKMIPRTRPVFPKNRHRIGTRFRARSSTKTKTSTSHSTYQKAVWNTRKRDSHRRRPISIPQTCKCAASPSVSMAAGPASAIRTVPKSISKRSTSNILRRIGLKPSSLSRPGAFPAHAMARCSISPGWSLRMKPASRPHLPVFSPFATAISICSSSRRF